MKLYEDVPASRKITFNFRISDEVRERLRYVARRLGCSPGFYAHNAMLDKLEADEVFIAKADLKKK